MLKNLNFFILFASISKYTNDAVYMVNLYELYSFLLFNNYRSLFSSKSLLISLIRYLGKKISVNLMDYKV